MFTHLHVHSAFSPAWGLHPPEALCAAARRMGMTSLALTDRNGLYGIPRFLEAAREAGLSPLIGAEAVHGGHRAVLLPRDGEGYANLCRLLSELHCRGDFDLPVALQRYRRGLVVLSDDASLLAVLRRSDREGLFVELSPGHQMHRALACARELGLPPVATGRALLLGEEDFLLHRVLRAIHLNTKLCRLPESETARPGDRLLPPDGMADFFPHAPEALENTARVAELCRFEWDFSATIFPAYGGLADAEAFAELERRAREGLLRRYGEIGTAAEERLRKELAVIGSKGFAHYFLVVEEIARQSPRTCGRGSAAASLVAYALEITHVDPLRHNLFFERFLNEGRLDPPDIDIDFPWDERDGVLDFAFARYGARRAAMVANQVGFKGRAALREVAKVYGFPENEIKGVTERISGYWDAPRTTAAMEEHPLFRGEGLSPGWEEVLAVASRLRGQLRHLSLHCGGLVVVPDEIRRYVPVEVSAKGLPVIQWEKDQAEASGLVKIDILGNRSLAVIRDALAAVEAHGGERIDYAAWRPFDDGETRTLLMRGETMGCFYIESPATRQLLQKMWGREPDSRAGAVDLFEHLVMASSIIRPAANAFIREFVARMRGKPWEPLHPLLREVLDETYGIAVYQEQITQMAMALAGFSPFEGDELRKIISKKHKGKRLDDCRERFLSGGEKTGVEPALLQRAWEQILSFGGYSFCKPHSASYALVSGKSAWLKAHYPAEFMAAVISNQGGYYAPFAYLSEAHRMGLSVLPPDVNESVWPYAGRERSVRIGLMQIHGLSRKGADLLLQARGAGGAFRGFRDFLRRVPADPDDVRRLVRAGAFDPLEGMERRPALLWELLAQKPGGGEGLLPFDAPALSLPQPSPYEESEVLRQEVETLGMLASRHPLTLHREAIRRARVIPAADLENWVGRYVAVAGWWVTGKVVQTHRDEPMEFVSFEDTSAIFDATFFPAAYGRFCRKLSRARPYILKGKVEEEFGVATLRVEWVGFLDEGPER